MMNRHRQVFEITKWEFFRWFKVKDQILTLLISCGLGLAVWGGLALLERTGQDPVSISVLNGHLLPPVPAEGSRFNLQQSVDGDEQALRQAVGRREIDGLLILRSADDADLVVFRQPAWKSELEQLLSQARLELRVRSLGISSDEFADLVRPFSITVVFGEEADRAAGAPEKIAAGVIIGLMLLAVFVSFAYQFVTITGEKQSRVTEQIISAVSPQQWVDGKILGVSAYAFASLVTYVVSILIFIGISGLFGEAVEIPVDFTKPLLVVPLALLGFCGMLFWNTFFAAIAATINDPNTSARGTMVFIPVVPTVIVALLALRSPDTALMQVLAVFPITSPTALAGRLVLTQVPLWEILSALFLLVVSIWLMRTVAGKIFHLGVLMYGKEPTIKEMLRWVREV